MSLAELIILGVALAMDAMAVALSNALCEPQMSRFKFWSMPLIFGLFQGLMPLIGYAFGELFSEALMAYSSWIVCFILGFLGIRMMREGIQELKNSSEDSSCSSELLSFTSLFLQALATSIDAMAVGVSLAVLGAHIHLAAFVIAVVTAVCCLFSLFLGSRFGVRFGSRAEVAGGMVLVMIALKFIWA